MMKLRQGVPRVFITEIQSLVTKVVSHGKYLEINENIWDKNIWATEDKNDDEHLSSLSSDSSGQLDVLWHNGDTLGVDGAQIGVLKQTNEISLTSLLK